MDDDLEQQTIEPDHNHESHPSLWHNSTLQVVGGITIALIGLLGIWLKVRKKHG